MENNSTKWYLLGFLGCVWGSSFILMQFGLQGVNSIQLGSLRILFAALFLMVVGFKQITKIPSYKWKYIALTSLVGTFIPAYLFAIALSKIDDTYFFTAQAEKEQSVVNILSYNDKILTISQTRNGCSLSIGGAGIIWGTAFGALSMGAGAAASLVFLLMAEALC